MRFSISDESSDFVAAEQCVGKNLGGRKPGQSQSVDTCEEKNTFTQDLLSIVQRVKSARGDSQGAPLPHQFGLLNEIASGLTINLLFAVKQSIVFREEARCG